MTHVVIMIYDMVTSKTYPLSLHDALPISSGHASAGELLYCYNIVQPKNVMPVHGEVRHLIANGRIAEDRSEEHTSELQSRGHLVCRHLLEKKKYSYR